MRIPTLVLLVFGLWAFFGTPTNTFFPNSAAPWERVDLAFYPDKHYLFHDISRFDVGSVANCRQMARQFAKEIDDPSFSKSDYECGVGYLRDIIPGGVRVYRLTVR